MDDWVWVRRDMSSADKMSDMKAVARVALVIRVFLSESLIHRWISET